MPEHLIHWDDVEPRHLDRGHIQSTWHDLARAAGTKGVGVRRLHLDDGAFSTPVHVHAADEEIVFVLDGAGLLWQDAETYELRAADCVVYKPYEEEHTLRGGPGGLDALVFGERKEVGLPYLPRAGVSWAWPSWVEVGGGDPPWDREIAAGPPECPPPSAERPANVVNADGVETEYGGTSRPLGRAAGSESTGLHLVTLPPGQTAAPRHCHSAEEEIFVVLDGSGTLYLGDDEHPVRRGHVLARPPATRVAHGFRAGPDSLTYLAYGTREPNDIAYYPTSGQVYLRGVGLITKTERLPYPEAF